MTKVRRTMVPEEVLSRWRGVFRFGDIESIRTFTGLSRPTISRAIEGSATEEVIRKINEYFVHKEQSGEQKKDDLKEELLNDFDYMNT